MAPTRFPFFLSILFLLVLVGSCSSDEQKIDYKNGILGHWEVSQAIRNGKPTMLLEDAYFDFSKDGALSFNLDGAPQQASYELDGHQILVAGSRMDSQYHIDSLSDTSMILNTQLRGFNFQFYLNKSTEQ